jgi:hypothetical protein
MQSFENKPTSPTKRLGVSLNIDTGYKGKGKDMSPPQTPPKMETSRASRANITAANRALKVRTGPRETFLDDITPIDPANRQNDPEKGRASRDSHDLSLSPRQVTRDSLVDHMLLSLDQFSFGHDLDSFGRQPTVEEERLYSTFGEDEGYQPTSNFPARNGRVIGGHTYSYSSDYDIPDDSSRYSGGQLSRGRRSNSSSNFQTTLGRINSKRDNSSFSGSRGQNQQAPPLGLHSRSGKGSKGSSANSFDLGYAQITSSQRWTHGLAGRSSSFDYGSDRLAMNAPPPPSMARQVETTIPAYNPYDYDAAPTPTVPGGPRRLRPASPIVIPLQEPAQVEPPLPKLERKRSTRSSKSGYKGKLSQPGRFDYGLNDRNRELPPMPAFIKEPAPAPSVGYGKAKDELHSSPGISQPPKEKPGFFRRVFGSSRNNPVHAPEPPPSHGSATSAETTDSPGGKRQHISTQMKSHLPSKEPPAPKEHTHVLTKKPSSFFRRRKKSVTEPEVPMPVPVVTALYVQAERDVHDKPLPSPVSSLRKVMNPYLRTPARSPIDLYPQTSLGQPFDDDDTETNNRTVRGFSPDYEPDKSATIRAVKDSAGASVESLHYSHTKSQSSVSAGQNTGPSRPQQEADITFLQDSSDNDQQVSDTTPSTAQTLSGPRQKNFSGSTRAPASVVADHTHPRPSPVPTRSEVPRSSPVINSPRSPTTSKLSLKKDALARQDEDWVMLTPSQPRKAPQPEHRVWLEPSSSEEDLSESNLAPPQSSTALGGKNVGSTDTVYLSATSLPILQIEGEDESRQHESRLLTATEAIKSLDAQVAADGISAPAESDRVRAKKIYDGNEDFIQKEKAAAWMGEEGPARARTLVAYMELYDFTNLNILAALRIMCSRLVLKAESQQVDRILVAFARRWCQCNPNHGFKGIGKNPSTTWDISSPLIIL